MMPQWAGDSIEDSAGGAQLLWPQPSAGIASRVSLPAEMSVPEEHPGSVCTAACQSPGAALSRMGLEVHRQNGLG